MNLSLKLALTFLLAITPVILVRGWLSSRNEISMLEAAMRRNHLAVGSVLSRSLAYVSRDEGQAREFLAHADRRHEHLETEDFDVVLTDLNMPGMNGLELCERITASRPGVPVIVVTAFGSLDTAVAAIRTGAYDFVTKPFDLESLEIALDRAVSHRRLQEEVKRLREQASGTRSHEGLVGESPMMLRLYETIDAIAASESSVLITGETGTGKELVARALHRGSSRLAGPFVPFNCSAVPEALLESELFGYRRGAFTDAKEGRTGLLVRANGGTIFLDEVGDMPLQLQPKLLRAIEERRVRPRTWRTTDARRRDPALPGWSSRRARGRG